MLARGSSGLLVQPARKPTEHLFRALALRVTTYPTLPSFNRHDEFLAADQDRDDFELLGVIAKAAARSNAVRPLTLS